MAEYIYGRTLRSQYDDYKEANDVITSDNFISDRARMRLLQKPGGASKNPGTLYDKYLFGSSVDEATYGNLWMEWNDGGDDRKEKLLPKINAMPISNEEKSKLYYSFGWGTSEKSLKGVPWPFVHIEEFEKKDE